MKEVYLKLLGGDRLTCTQLLRFVMDAWKANMDYKRVRQTVKAATELAHEIADAAGDLAGLLDKAAKYVDYLPPELFDVTSALVMTEHYRRHPDVTRCQDMRRVVLGDPRQKADDMGIDPLEAERKELVEAELTDQTETASDQLHDAWATAPSVAQIIATLGRSAKSCEPSEDGFRGAALDSRKSKRKYEYLRAFCLLLRDEQRLDLTNDIMRAMAITATVALNDPEDSVTAAEVRYARDHIANSSPGRLAPDSLG